MKNISVYLILVMALIGCQSAPPTGSGAALVDFGTEEGMKRFDSSDAKIDFFRLANQFEAQSNALFCGPTTAAIVLNTVRAGKTDKLPKDKHRYSKSETRYLPKGIDISLGRYTQENIFEKSPKSRAEVFGKPIKINNKKANDFGYQLRQFEALLQAHGLKTQLRVVDEKLTDDIIQKELIENLKRPGDYVIVNYKRTEVGQQGGGHISPIGAYDSKSGSFLVLDVNPTKAAWVWMPTATLIKGMRSADTIENRGYILVEGES